MKVRGLYPVEVILVSAMLKGLQEHGWQEIISPNIMDRLLNADINGIEEVIRPTIIESDKDEIITREQQDKIDSDVLDFDNLLGVYYPEQKTIKLFTKCIEVVAKKLSISEQELQDVVLLHEFGHWITHKLPYEEQREWGDFCNCHNHDVLEGWAQLLTWWVVKDIPKLKNAFCKLNNKQSPPYQVWKQFENSSTLTLSLFREYNCTDSTLEDWKTFDDVIKKYPNSNYDKIKYELRGYLLAKATGTA
jgi:hypothetical protein